MDSLIQTLGEMLVGGGGLCLTLLVLSGLAFGAATAWNKVGRKVRGIYQDELLFSMFCQHREEFLKWLNDKNGRNTPCATDPQTKETSPTELWEKINERTHFVGMRLDRCGVFMSKAVDKPVQAYWGGTLDAYSEEFGWLREVLKDG